MRTCAACGEVVLPTRPGEQRKLTCVTTPDHARVVKPPTCWEIRFPKYGRSLLGTIKAVEPRNAFHRLSMITYKEMVEAIATVAETREISLDDVLDWSGQYGRWRLLRLVRALDAAHPIRRSLEQHIDAERSRESSSHQTKFSKKVAAEEKASALQNLPEDFKKALEAFRHSRLVIERVKIERGVKVSSYTNKRLLRESEKICLFFAEIGLRNWEEMAPRHYSLFRLKYGMGAACGAYLFLKFVKKMFPRVTAKISRPKVDIDVITNRLAEENEAKRSIQASIDAGEDSTALLFCLVGIYAQTIVACTRLTIGSFRRSQGQIEALFAEIWLPLDTVTSELLRRHLVASGFGNEAIDDQDIGDLSLFQQSYDQLRQLMKSKTKESAHKLRLRAIANVLARGFTDRNGLHRSFGMSYPAIRDVEKIFGWQLQASVSKEARQHRRDLLNGKLNQH